MSSSIFVSFSEHFFTSWSAIPIATIMARSKKSKPRRTIIHVRIRARSRVQPILNSSIRSSPTRQKSERSSKSLVSDGRWTKTSGHFVRRVSNRSTRQPKVFGQTNDRQRDSSSRDVENIDVSWWRSSSFLCAVLLAGAVTPAVLLTRPNKQTTVSSKSNETHFWRDECDVSWIMVCEWSYQSSCSFV